MSGKVRFDPNANKWAVFITFANRRKAKYFECEIDARSFADRINKILALGDPTLIKQALGVEPKTESAKTETTRPIPDLASYSTMWLDSRKKTIRRVTWASYEAQYRLHLIPQFGKWPISEIDYAALRAFCVAKHKDGYSWDSIRIMIAALRACLSEAVRERTITSNPAADLGRTYTTASRREEVDPFTVEELRSIEKHTQEKRPDLYPFILCLARTGMRIGEAVGLDWEDLDFTSRQIMIRRSVASAPQGKREVSKTKTGKERRSDMSEDLAKALLGYRKVTLESLLSCGVHELSGPMFRSRDSRRLSYSAIRPVWMRLQRAAGVRLRGIHCLRHTFASVLLSRNVPILYVSSQLGHASPRTTLDVYSHWVPAGTGPQAVNLLDVDSGSASNLQVNASSGGSGKGHQLQVADNTGASGRD